MSHVAAGSPVPASSSFPVDLLHHSVPRRLRRQTESAVQQQQQQSETIHAHHRPTRESGGTTHSATLSRRPGTAHGPTRRGTLKMNGNMMNSSESQQPLSPADPRDTGRAGALTTSAGDASAPVVSFPSSPSASTSQVPPSPRVPQTRFNFEYQYPLRRRALTSQTGLPSVDASPTSIPDPDPVSASASASTPPTPQRTLLHDRSRRSVPGFSFSQPHRRTPAASASQPPSPGLALEEDSDSATPLDATGSTVRVLSPNATKRRKQSFNAHQTSPNVKRRMPSSTVSYLQSRAPTDERAHRAVNGNGMENGFDKYGSEDGARTPVADDSRLKNEDIFLNIARSDSTRRESFGRSDFRRSRFRMSGSGLRTPASRANEPTPSPDQLRSNNYATPLHSNNGSPSNPSGPRAYSYSLSEHPLEDHSKPHHSGYVASSRTAIGLPRSRLSNVGIDSSSQYPESNGERRASFQDPRLFRNSTLSTIRSSRQTSTSEATERARIESDRTRQDGTESTLSTTSPSTVWDELEDLKSRIRKLELTGKLPPSSQEAISSASADRPRTATTTVTTVSSSPNHGRQTSNPSAESETVPPNPVHPLLQSAMAKAKTLLNKEVYMTLDATVTDAIALSNNLHAHKASSSGVSGVNGYGTSDRQSRRKADSVCRSLTELCLALSDEQLRRQQAADQAKPQQPNGVAEEETYAPAAPALPHQQSTTREPEGLARRQSTRLTSRLEARRASLAQPNASPSGENSSTVNRSSDSTLDAKQPHSPGSSTPLDRPLGRLNRLSTSLRVRRVQTEDENPASAPPGRSISRSVTEIANPAATHRSPRQRISYGYTTSQQPPEIPQDHNARFSAQSQQSQSQLPQPRTPTASQSGIPLRRSLMTPTSYTPATPRSNIQAGSRRYGLSAAATFDGTMDDASSSIAPAESASHTRIVAPSTKVAGSYTPISQNRLRANSLGARRFGMRSRPMAAGNDAVNLDDSID
ncbi:putative LPXTG-motif cell wall anchor domain protein [Aspergillus affinis]|uniref:putative LPXTG-motif cell wall anchor domain protein n=1 Tax=Aspergillus affinis TaxID=1070780 RepID=UPI0022FDDCF6|nr:uncharacterized protein KD926_007300 [Aspergillus affinis]KAI9041188.1 hypothetical protein KD926_007300 [Aspergillus affinis]